MESVEFPNAPSIQGFDESFLSFNSLSLSLICLYGNFMYFSYNKVVFVLRVIDCIYYYFYFFLNLGGGNFDLFSRENERK